MNRQLFSRAAGAWESPYLLLTMVAVFWAGNAIVARAAREVVPPVTLACARWTVAFLLVSIFAWRHLRRDASDLRLYWKGTLVLGLIGVGLYNTLLYVGLHFTTASNALLVGASQPALILLLGAAIFRDRAGAVRVAGIALSMLGVVTIVARGDFGQLLRLQFNRGDALVLVASAIWALYTVLLRLRPPVHALSFLASTFAIGALLNLPLALGEFAAGAHFGDLRIAAASIAYVGIFPSLLAYLLFNRAVAMIGPAAAGQFLNLVPVFGALIAAALLGEPLRIFHFIGMVLILAGIILFSRGRAAPARGAETVEGP